MQESESIVELTERLEAGDEDAANEIWKSCFSRLINLARKKLRGVPYRIGDEEDVVVSAFESFFKASQLGRFPNLKHRDDLHKIASLKLEGFYNHEIAEMLGIDVTQLNRKIRRIKQIWDHHQRDSSD